MKSPSYIAAFGRGLLALLAACALLGMAADSSAAAGAPVVKRFDTEGPVWSLCPVKDGYALSEVPNQVVVVSRQGKRLKSYDVGGLPLSLAVGRFKADGPEVIVVAVQDNPGSLCCLANEPEGLRLLWRYVAANPPLSVSIGHAGGGGAVAAGSYGGLVYLLDASGRLKWSRCLGGDGSVGAVKIGDLDGDGRGDVVAGTSDDGVFALSGTGKRLWHLSTKLPEAKRRINELLNVETVHICDLDGDGKPEVVIGSRPFGMVTVLSGDGKLLWRKSFPDHVNTYSGALVEPVDLNGDGKKDLVCLLRGIILKGDRGTTPLLVLDSQGNLLAGSYPEVSFISLASAPPETGGRQKLLLSSPTRGRGFYTVDYPGAVAPISVPRPRDALDTLAAAVDRMAPRPSPDKAAPKRPIHVLVPIKMGDIEPRAVTLMSFCKGMSAPGLTFELMITNCHEAKGKERDGYRPYKEAARVFSREQIAATARFLEQKRFPFYVQLAKICQPWMRLATCRAIMEAAPTQFRGFLTNECNPTRVNKFERYVEFARKVMDLCHEHGDKKYIMDEYLNFWNSVPANPRYFAALFKPEYKNVVVPMYKTNQAEGPEQMIGMLLGLWKSGVVAEWGFCTEEDLWKWEYPPFINPPHDVILRLDVMAGMLGANYYRIEENREFIRAKGAGYVVEDGARRHRYLYHSLIRKGAVRPAQSADEVIVSPVVLRKAEDGLDQSLRHSEYWQHVFERRGLWAFSQALQTTRGDYPYSYLYNMRHGYDGLFPDDPYGLVAILPDHLRAGIPGTRASWSLTGHAMRGEDGKAIPEEKVKDTLMASFSSAARDLPVTAQGCFTAIRKEKGGYLVYLLDTGQLDVRDRTVTVRLARPEGVASVTDVISGERLKPAGGALRLMIPAGTLRILDVRLKEAPAADRAGPSPAP